MPLGAKLLGLRVTFFLERTRSRVLELRKLLKSLSLPPHEGAHWLNASFLEPDPAGLVFNLHIDDHAAESGDGNLGLWVEVSIRPRPASKVPSAIAGRPRSDWMIQELSKLMRKLELGFFDGDVSVPSGAQEPPTNVVAIPLKIGSRTLPVIGVEYGGEPDPGTVDGFRWTRTPQGIMVRLSYSRELNASELSNIWASERERIGTYVQEALTR